MGMGLRRRAAACGLAALLTASVAIAQERGLTNLEGYSLTYSPSGEQERSTVVKFSVANVLRAVPDIFKKKEKKKGKKDLEMKDPEMFTLYEIEKDKHGIQSIGRKEEKRLEGYLNPIYIFQEQPETVNHPENQFFVTEYVDNVLRLYDTKVMPAIIESRKAKGLPVTPEYLSGYRLDLMIGGKEFGMQIGVEEDLGMIAPGMVIDKRGMPMRLSDKTSATYTARVKFEFAPNGAGKIRCVGYIPYAGPSSAPSQISMKALLFVEFPGNERLPGKYFLSNNWHEYSSSENTGISVIPDELNGTSAENRGPPSRESAMPEIMQH